ncbi:hypothetical protein SprV_0602106800 [Sparganum proliferum]
MISEEQMKHILDAQQASFIALLIEMQRNWGPASRENKRKQIEQRITEFVYDPEGGVNFEAWFRKYEGLFEEEGAELNDKTKVEIILLKLAQREHERISTPTRDQPEGRSGEALNAVVNPQLLSGFLQRSLC